MTGLTLDLYQVDAFSQRIFSGNPAAVVPLDDWPDDSLLQAIASENNLSETAFFQGQSGRYQLRWFTPACEVPLCGHATLATAFVIFRHFEPHADQVVFDTSSGELTVGRSGDALVLDFPAYEIVSCNAPEQLIKALGLVPKSVGRTEPDHNYYVVLGSQAEVANLQPDMVMLKALHPYGVVVTARGDNCDFVSRYFAPSYGIPEDPVTGSIHCALVPYWSARLGRTTLSARQISDRGGDIECEWQAERVLLKGFAVEYLKGQIYLPQDRLVQSSAVEDAV